MFFDLESTGGSMYTDQMAAMVVGVPNSVNITQKHYFSLVRYLYSSKAQSRAD